MKPQPFVVTSADHPRPFNIVGEQITVLASGEATGGYEIFLQHGPQGSGPPPHHHGWDESFYVIKGQIAFGWDGETMTALPGTLVHLPAGTTHWFRFGEGGGEMVSITSRLGASRMFDEFDRSVSPVKPDLEALGRIAMRHGMSVVV